MRTAAKPKVKKPLGPVRVRYEPPTLDEAIIAARGLSDDIEAQAEIAAELIGVDVGTARARLFATRPAENAGPEIVSGGRRVVVVERRPLVRRQIRPAAAR
jgi:hypothetical protein